jgi:hypothetical protein
MIGEAVPLVGLGGTPEEISDAMPSSRPRPKRANVGVELDRLIRVLPSGAAREFARGLPRRIGQFELLVCLEALVRLIQADERHCPSSHTSLRDSRLD